MNLPGFNTLGLCIVPLAVKSTPDSRLLLRREAYRENNEIQYCSLAEAKGKGEGEGEGKADSDCIVLCAVVLLNLSAEAYTPALLY